jgi:pimeloyl-ACP methyl ester carboxylesterase
MSTFGCMFEPSSRRAAIALLAAAMLLAGVSACADTSASHRLATRGITLYYETEGHGPPLLLLHGGLGNGTQFDKQRPAFAPSHRLIVPDCCAQGRTTDRPGPLTYHDMAEDMIALMDSLKLARVDIMGWSDGGNIGLDMAIHHPDRVDHLVTFGANATIEGLPPADRAWNRTATAESLGTGMKVIWTSLNPQPDHYREAMNKILEMWRTLPAFTTEQLTGIRARVLVCAGEHDLILPEHTAMLAHTIPGAAMWIVPGASHGAMRERPDLVNPRVLAFLAQGATP